MKMEQEHAIFFDGTSYFIDDVTLKVDSDTEIVFVSSNYHLCCTKCDELNDTL